MEKPQSAKIRLSNGMEVTVDPEDYGWLNTFEWEFYKRDKYAYTRFKEGETLKHKLMHRMIAIHHGLIPDNSKVIVDHKNNNRLDNRKANLRMADGSQNAANRRKCKKKCSSKFKGVSWDSSKQKFKAYIKSGGKTKHLGYFECQKQAATAYNRAAKKIFGEFANLNDIGGKR